MSAPRIAVVVPTYRRPALLARCLDALLQQTLQADDYEIIVCDDGPDAATRALVMKHGELRPQLRYIAVCETQGPAAARNRGWNATQAAVVAFTDDDTIPAPDWLAYGLATIETGADAVAGRILVPLPPAPSDYERDAAGLARAEFATANCFVRRTALLAVGGFDERFGAAWREDSDLQFMLLQRGARIVRCDSAVVAHPVRPAGFGVSLSQQRKIVYDGLLYRKHPQLYRSCIRPHARWDYYLCVLALLVALAALPTQATAVAAVAATLWLVLTLRFCWQRLRDTRRTPRHVLEMLLTSIAIPPLAVWWRLVAIGRWRVPLF